MRSDDDDRTTGWRHFRGIIAAVVTAASSKVGTAATRGANGAAPANRPPWSTHIRALEDALAQNNQSAAVRAWHAAHVAAFASRRWDGLIEVGDAYLKIGEASGSPRSAFAKARELYLTALFRARELGDADGALRVAQAFAALGEREVTEQCLVVARDLAARVRNPKVEARVRAVAELLAAR